MKCNHIKKLLSDYIDGYLNDVVKKEFEEHISTCKECASLLGDLISIRKEVRKIRIPKPSPFIFERVNARLEEKSSKRVCFRPVFLKIAFASSFSIALILSVSFHFINKEREDYAKRYIKELYIIQNEVSGYHTPIYNVENDYVVQTGRSETF